MPGRITKLMERVHDAVDEWNERIEDGRTGRRNKYGLKTALWYEEEERKRRRRHRRRHHHGHRDSSRRRDREGGEEHSTPGEEDPTMTGGNREPSGEQHEPGDSPEGVEGASRDEHHRRRRHRSGSRDRRHRHHRHRRHRSRSGSRSQSEDQKSHRRRTRGEEESQPEILKHNEEPRGQEPQDREIPQTDGAGDQDDRNRWQGPQLQKRRHPKMKPYDDGGLGDLVKAVVANLKEEQARRKGKGRSPYGQYMGRSRQGHAPSGRRRSPRASPEGFITGAEYPIEPEDPFTSPPESRTHSEGHITPPVDPAVEVERRQQEEIDAERGLEASMHGGGAEIAEDPAIEAERRQQEEIDAEHTQDAAPEAETGHASSEGSSHASRQTSVESTHSSRTSQQGTERAQPGNPALVRGNESRERPVSDAASTTASTHALAPESTTQLRHPGGHLNLETDDETSEFQDSGDETAQSITSTQATVPSSNPGQRRHSPRTRGNSLLPGHASDPSTYAGTVASREGPASTRGSRGHGRRVRGRGGGGGSRPSGIRGGGGDDDESGDKKSSNLYEDFDDEYDYEYEHSSDVEIIDDPPVNRWYGPPNGMPSYWNPPTGHQDWYDEGFQERKPRVRRLNPSYMEEDDYMQITGHPQPPPRASHPPPQPTRSSWNPFAGIFGGSGQQTDEPPAHIPANYEQRQYPGAGPSYGRNDPTFPYAGPRAAFTGHPSYFPDLDAREQRQTSGGYRPQVFGTRPAHNQGPRVQPGYFPFKSSESDSDTNRRRAQKGKPRRDQDRPSKANRRRPKSPEPSSEDSEPSDDTDSDEPPRGPSGNHSSHRYSPPPRSGGHGRKHGGNFYNPPAAPEERTDYYAILGVRLSATAEQIKTAAKKMRIATHPDKVAGLSEMTTEQKAAVNDRAAKVGQAADVLLDMGKRRRYDRGEEV